MHHQHHVTIIGFSKQKKKIHNTISLHTLTKQSWKCILRRGAARVGATDIILAVSFFTIDSTEGHVFL